MLIAVALIYALSGESLMISDRLGRLWRPPSQESVEPKKSSRQEFTQTIISGVAKLLPSSSPSDGASEADPRLIHGRLPWS